jgi:type III pantothenate kinase
MNLLAVDIGNTNINCGLFLNGRLAKRFSISTKEKTSYQANLREHLTVEVDDIIICSVVPLACAAIEKTLKKISGIKPKVLGRDAVVPIKNLYSAAKQVGQDRLVNAYAVVKLYGSPAVVADFGTAVTFDVVSRNREYLGGLILPGLNISLDALSERTALLPRVKLSRPNGLIGKNTRGSILSGVVYGFAALTDDLIERLRSQIGRNAKAIGTGGNISLIGPYCKKLQVIDQDLTLKGINLIYLNPV